MPRFEGKPARLSPRRAIFGGTHIVIIARLTPSVSRRIGKYGDAAETCIFTLFFTSCGGSKSINYNDIEFKYALTKETYKFSILHEINKWDITDNLIIIHTKCCNMHMIVGIDNIILYEEVTNNLGELGVDGKNCEGLTFNK